MSGPATTAAAGALPGMITTGLTSSNASYYNTRKGLFGANYTINRLPVKSEGAIGQQQLGAYLNDMNTERLKKYGGVDPLTGDLDPDAIGIYRQYAMTKDGSAIKNAPVIVDGRMMKTGKKGHVRVLDEAFMRDEQAKLEEIEKEIDELQDYGLISNWHLSHLLGVTPTELVAGMEEGGDMQKMLEVDIGVDPDELKGTPWGELKKVTGLPDSIKGLSPHNATFAASVMKIRLAIRHSPVALERVKVDMAKALDSNTGDSGKK